MDTESLQNFGERVAADETLAKVRFRHENDLVALEFVDPGDRLFQTQSMKRSVPSSILHDGR
jgi:hypothetical protein